MTSLYHFQQDMENQSDFTLTLAMWNLPKNNTLEQHHWPLHFIKKYGCNDDMLKFASSKQIGSYYSINTDCFDWWRLKSPLSLWRECAAYVSDKERNMMRHKRKESTSWCIWVQRFCLLPSSGGTCWQVNCIKLTALDSLLMRSTALRNGVL